MSSRFFLLAGLILMLLAVVIGAFGAHAIEQQVSANRMVTWQTGTEYHFYHALGLIALGIYYRDLKLDRWAQGSGWLLLMGIVLFSGSLYLLVLTGNSRLGMITPVGGLFFIAGWLSWIISVSKQPRG